MNVQETSDRIRKRLAPKKHMYVERPAYIITESELRTLENAATIARKISHMKLLTDICPRCGSGLVNGEHIANYPPCNGE